MNIDYKAAIESLTGATCQSYTLLTSTIQATLLLPTGKGRSTFLSRVQVVSRALYPAGASDWQLSKLSDRIAQYSYRDVAGTRAGYTVYIGYPSKAVASKKMEKLQFAGHVAAYHVRKGKHTGYPWEAKLWGLTNEALFEFLVVDRPPVSFAIKADHVLVWLSESPATGVHKVADLTAANQWAAERYRRLSESNPPTEDDVATAIEHFLSMTGSSQEILWEFDGWIKRNLATPDNVAAAWLILEEDQEAITRQIAKLKQKLTQTNRMRGQFSGHEGDYIGTNFTMSITKGRRRVWLNCPPESLPEQYQRHAIVGHNITVEDTQHPDLAQYCTVTHSTKVEIKEKENAFC